MTFRTARMLIIGAIVAGLVAGLWLYHVKNPPPLKVQFIGFTNQFHGMGLEAILAVTNQSDVPFFLIFYPERMKPEPPMRFGISWDAPVVLFGRSATNKRVYLQPNVGTWRVRVTYYHPLTSWQGLRNRWAAKLVALRWRRVAGWIAPKIYYDVFTPEMELK